MLGVWLLAPASSNGYLKALGGSVLLLLAQAAAVVVAGLQPLAGLAVFLIAPFAIARWLYGMSFFRTFFLQLFIAGLTVVLGAVLRPQLPGMRAPGLALPTTVVAEVESAASVLGPPREHAEPPPSGGGLRSNAPASESPTLRLRIAGHQVVILDLATSLKAVALEQTPDRWATRYEDNHGFQGQLTIAARARGASLAQRARTRRDAFLRAHPGFHAAGAAEPGEAGDLPSITYAFEGGSDGEPLRGGVRVLDARALGIEVSGTWPVGRDELTWQILKDLPYSMTVDGK
jgi:hypothetical protein